MADCVNALKEWTGKARATVVYDSTVDEFTNDGLFHKIKGKQNIAVIGFTTDGDVFGGFYTVAATKLFEDVRDPNVFTFSFESHGRCMTPQRFVVKAGLSKEVYVRFKKNHTSGFVFFGLYSVGCGFYLGNERSNSCCCYMSRAFEGLEDRTLTGKNFPKNHHCTRLVAVLLE